MQITPLNIARHWGGGDGRVIFDFNPRLRRLLETGRGVVGSFTRAGTASYIDPVTGEVKAGERTNLVLYSEDFSQSEWTDYFKGTITQNAILAPDGVSYAQRVTSGVNDRLQYDGLNPTNRMVKSIWARAVSGSGTVALLGYNTYAKYQFELDETWRRFEVPVDTSETGGLAFYGVDFRYGTLTDIYIWGAQLEIGTQATSYIPTNGAAVTVVDGADTNIPRFESVDSRWMLLHEGQATNLVPYSQDATQWAENGTCTVTAGETIVGIPAFTLSGQALNWHRRNFITKTLTGTYTISVFAKSGSQSAGKITIYDVTASLTTAVDINTSMGTLSNVSQNAGTTSGSSEAVGGGYRFTVIFTPANDGNVFVVGLGTGTTTPTDTIIVTGAQVVEGTDYSSYIPTSGDTATRSTEAAYPQWTMTQAMVDAVSAGGEGTLIVEWVPGFDSDDVALGANTGGLINFSASTPWKGLYLYRAPGGAGAFIFHDGGDSTQIFYNYEKGTRYILAASWGGSEKYLGLVYPEEQWSAADTYSGSIQNDGNLSLGHTNEFPQHFGRIKMFNRKLTQDQISQEVSTW